MITLTLNLTNLNNSLQVGDAIYSVPTRLQSGAEHRDQAQVTGTNFNQKLNNQFFVGILRRIVMPIDSNSGFFELDVDETTGLQALIDPNAPSWNSLIGDFLMFSKYDQNNGDVIGYYAQAKFVNNSKEKAELFSVGSEVIINSK